MNRRTTTADFGFSQCVEIEVTAGLDSRRTVTGMIKRLVTAAGFTLLYVSMYPVLAGEFVIYHYPNWPPPLAATYVLSGILLQAWFCFGRRERAGRPHALWPQIVTGIVYAAAVGAFPGGISLS